MESGQLSNEENSEQIIKCPFTNMTRNVFHCFLSAKESIHKFYVDTVGMQLISETKSSAIYGFRHNLENRDCALEFIFSDHFTKSCHSDRDNAYWKIGLGCPDINVARDSLRKKEIEVGEPSQFKDIGYLCHLSDADGFTIELLQHHFESNFDPKKVAAVMEKDKYPMGSKQVVVGQITLRISDVERSLHFYGEIMGMKYLSKQPVDEYAFTLYFLGYPDDDEKMPNSEDLEAVENREWLWQRPYTTLELQHRTKRDPKQGYTLAKENETGWQGIVFQSQLDADATIGYLKKCGVQSEAMKGTNRVKCQDPDGYIVLIDCKDK